MYAAISGTIKSSNTLYTLGPKDYMLVDFWRLVWQERPPTIVMVTNLQEGSKKKCEQYWPDSGSKEFGPFKVTLTEQQVSADYTTRTMQVTVSILLWSLSSVRGLIFIHGLKVNNLWPCMHLAVLIFNMFMFHLKINYQQTNECLYEFTFMI